MKDESKIQRDKATDRKSPVVVDATKAIDIAGLSGKGKPKKEEKESGGFQGLGEAFKKANSPAEKRAEQTLKLQQEQVNVTKETNRLLVAKHATAKPKNLGEQRAERKAEHTKMLEARRSEVTVTKEATLLSGAYTKMMAARKAAAKKPTRKQRKLASARIRAEASGDNRTLEKLQTEQLRKMDEQQRTLEKIAKSGGLA